MGIYLQYDSMNNEVIKGSANFLLLFRAGMSKVQPGSQSRHRVRLYVASSFYLSMYYLWPAKQILKIMQVRNAIFLFTSWWQQHSNFAWLCDPCCDPYQKISAMATVDKKREVDVEGHQFQERCKFIIFFH